MSNEYQHIYELWKDSQNAILLFLFIGWDFLRLPFGFLNFAQGQMHKCVQTMILGTIKCNNGLKEILKEL